MTLLTFRLSDDNFEMLSSFIVWARSTAVVHIAVFEVSKIGQKHIHMLFEPINVTKSAWIQAFHKFFKNRWVGNKSYSCSALIKEKENFYIYCCKGTRFKEPEVMFTLLSSEEVNKYWLKYWEDKPVEEDKTILVKPKKKSDPTWSELLTQQIKQEYPNRDWCYDAGDISLLWSIVTKNLGKASKKLNAMIIRDLVCGQLNALTDGECSGMNKDFKQQAFPNLFGKD